MFGLDMAGYADTNGLASSETAKYHAAGVISIVAVIALIFIPAIWPQVMYWTDSYRRINAQVCSSFFYRTAVALGVSQLLSSGFFLGSNFFRHPSFFRRKKVLCFSFLEIRHWSLSTCCLHLLLKLSLWFSEIFLRIRLVVVVYTRLAIAAISVPICWSFWLLNATCMCWCSFLRAGSLPLCPVCKPSVFWSRCANTRKRLSQRRMPIQIPPRCPLACKREAISNLKRTCLH